MSIKETAIEAIQTPVNKYAKLFQGVPYYPTVDVPSNEHLIPRTNTTTHIQAEAEKFAGLYQAFDDNNTLVAISGITCPASGHTPYAIDKAKMVDAVENHTGIRPEQLERFPSGTQVPEHLTVWMWGGDRKVMDMSDIAALPNERRTPYFEAIHTKTAQALTILADAGNIQNDQLSEEIKLYGVYGFTSIPLQRELGMSRGGQSQESWHLQAVRLRGANARAKFEMITPDDLAKQCAPWDSHFFHLFEASITSFINKTAKRQIGEENVKQVKSYTNHGSEGNDKGIYFSEGYKIQLRHPVTLENGMQLIADVVDHYQVLYNFLIMEYANYHKNSGDEKSQKEILNRVHGFIRSGKFSEFSEKDARNFNKLLLTLPPTHRQLVSWISDLESTDKSVKSQNSLDILQRLQKTYAKRYKFLSSPDGYRRSKSLIANAYQMSNLEADIIISLLKQTYLPPQGPDEAPMHYAFTMPGRLSGSFNFTRYIYNPDTGQIGLNELELETSLGTTQGFIEKYFGFFPKRIQA